MWEKAKSIMKALVIESKTENRMINIPDEFSTVKSSSLTSFHHPGWVVAWLVIKSSSPSTISSSLETSVYTFYLKDVARVFQDVRGEGYGGKLPRKTRPGRMCVTQNAKGSADCIKMLLSSGAESCSTIADAITTIRWYKKIQFCNSQIKFVRRAGWNAVQSSSGEYVLFE